MEEQKQSYCQHSIGVIMSEAHLQEPQPPSTSYQLYSGSCLPPGADSHFHECWKLPHGHPKAARQAIQSSDSSRHLRISMKHCTSGLGLQHPKKQWKGQMMPLGSAGHWIPFYENFGQWERGDAWSLASRFPLFPPSDGLVWHMDSLFCYPGYPVTGGYICWWPWLCTSWCLTFLLSLTITAPDFYTSHTLSIIVVNLASGSVFQRIWAETVVTDIPILQIGRIWLKLREVEWLWSHINNKWQAQSSPNSRSVTYYLCT